jgi:hypothetical protein
LGPVRGPINPILTTGFSPARVSGITDRHKKITAKLTVTTFSDFMCNLLFYGKDKKLLFQSGSIEDAGLGINFSCNSPY